MNQSKIQNRLIDALVGLWRSPSSIVLYPLMLISPYFIYMIRGSFPSALPGYVVAVFMLLVFAVCLLRQQSLMNAVMKHPIFLLSAGIAALGVTACTLGYQWNPHARYPEIFNFYSEMLDTMNGGFFTHHTEYRSEFAIHFSPVLLLVYPFFTLHPEPLTLYIASAVGLSLAVPLAYRFLKPDWGEGPAALLAFGAVLFPSILSLYSDFSPVRFAPPAIWLVILAYKSGDMKKFAAAFLVCLLVKETLPLAIFMISGVALLQKKKMNWIIIPGLVSIVAFLFINSVLIPWFADTPNKTSTIAAQFGYWGQTAPSVIIGFLKDPVSVITALSRPNNFAYALKLGHGVLFLLPLGSPLVLLAIPEFFVNTLAGYNPAILPYYYTGPWTSFLGHYSATIGTVLWAAACDSFVIKEVSETNTEDLQRSRWVRACLLFVAVLSTVIYPTNAENIL